MSYNKLGFTSGQTLKAEHLNHMEEGIANAGGVTSWNDLEDKPFEELPPAFDIQWDGVIGDRFALDLSSFGFLNTYFVKVSDEVFTVEQLVGAKFTQSNGNESELTSSNIDAVTYPGALDVNGGVIVVYSQEDLNATLGLPSGYITNGTYFVYIVDAQYTNRLVAPSTIIKINTKFLPEMNIESLGLHSIAKTGNYNDLYNRPTVYSDVIRYNVTQNLGSSAKQTARNNISVYSKSEVDTKIANIKPSVDLSEYPKTSEVETMIANTIGSAIGGSY